jgi:hypothetical protein
MTFVSPILNLGFVCTACGQRGGYARPNWDQGKPSLVL